MFRKDCIKKREKKLHWREKKCSEHNCSNFYCMFNRRRKEILLTLLETCKSLTATVTPMVKLRLFCACIDTIQENSSKYSFTNSWTKVTLHFSYPFALQNKMIYFFVFQEVSFHFFRSMKWFFKDKEIIQKQEVNSAIERLKTDKHFN